MKGKKLHPQTNPEVEQLAKDFSSILLRDIGEESLQFVNFLHSLVSGSGCHSHDYCDANMSMDEALQKFLGREVETDTETEHGERDMNLFNAAWDLAIANNFFLPEIDSDEYKKSLKGKTVIVYKATRKEPLLTVVECKGAKTVIENENGVTEEVNTSTLKLIKVISFKDEGTFYTTKIKAKDAPPLTDEERKLPGVPYGYWETLTFKTRNQCLKYALMNNAQANFDA